mmetsp:Transcript_26984/g.40847  ORF Transcript_26984/g.40847 Transcript_26984/m.40847 type:complete len:232 (-) Transcript_26984:877-1572(-)
MLFFQNGFTISKQLLVKNLPTEVVMAIETTLIRRQTAKRFVLLHHLLNYHVAILSRNPESLTILLRWRDIDVAPMVHGDTALVLLSNLPVEKISLFCRMERSVMMFAPFLKKLVLVRLSFLVGITIQQQRNANRSHTEDVRATVTTLKVKKHVKVFALLSHAVTSKKDLIVLSIFRNVVRMVPGLVQTLRPDISCVKVTLSKVHCLVHSVLSSSTLLNLFQSVFLLPVLSS